LFLRSFRPYVTGRADAALEQPGLVVEAVRVDVAVRPAKAHRQPPALAGMHLALGLGLLFAGDRAAIPGQQDLLRQPLAVGRRLHLELEAHAALHACRQAGDHADHVDIPPFELRRQPVAHAQVRERRRPEESACESAKG
jgi:hypothetical protein